MASPKETELEPEFDPAWLTPEAWDDDEDEDDNDDSAAK